MLLRKLVVVGLAGIFSLAANIATAEDAVGPSVSFVDGINLADPNADLADRFSVEFSAASAPRFALTTQPRAPEAPDYREYEVALVARSVSGIDVAFAQRGSLGFNDEGDIERESRASELRLGRGLRNLRQENNEPSGQGSWYFFAASEDEALTWRPGVRNDFGGSSASFALQERVEIGDMQAGITYAANGWEASLAYVEREFSVRTGSRTISQDEDFTGLTLTMRH